MCCNPHGTVACAVILKLKLLYYLIAEAEEVHLSGRSSSLPSSSVPSSSVPSSSVPSSSLTEIVQPHMTSGLRTIFPKKNSFKFWKNKKRVETADAFPMSHFCLNEQEGHVTNSQIVGAQTRNEQEGLFPAPLTNSQIAAVQQNLSTELG